MVILPPQEKPAQAASVDGPFGVHDVLRGGFRSHEFELRPAHPLSATEDPMNQRRLVDLDAEYSPVEHLTALSRGEHAVFNDRMHHNLLLQTSARPETGRLPVHLDTLKHWEDDVDSFVRSEALFKRGLYVSGPVDAAEAALDRAH